MSENTKIEWCDSTFNPWVGCTKVSPACDNCYASVSTPAKSLRVAWGAGNPRHRTSPANWNQPERWNARADAFRECAACGWRGDLALRDEPVAFACPSCDATDWKPARRRVFCASLADVFDNEVPKNWRFDLFKLIRATPDLDWLLLTKRVGNVSAMLNDAAAAVTGDFVGAKSWDSKPWPNVWLGATITSQAEADRDIPKLLAVPAAKRFLSMEPLLGAVDLRNINLGDLYFLNALTGVETILHDGGMPPKYQFPKGIDWVIVGGESGPNARPMHPEWVRSLRDQCAAADVPFLFKQWGEWAPQDAFDSGNGHSLYWRCYRDGQWTELSHAPDGNEVARCGKRRAGRLLDGVEHNGFPESAVTP